MKQELGGVEVLDLNYLKQNFDYIKDQLNKRPEDYSDKLISLLELGEKRKSLIIDVEKLKARKNKLSKLIADLIKDKKVENIEKTKVEILEINSKVNLLDKSLRTVENEILEINLQIPNVPNQDIPLGDSEKDNREIRTWERNITKKNKGMPHWDIASKLGLVDFEYGSRLSGSRFITYSGEGSKLVRYIADILLREHEKRGYKEYFLPVLVNEENMIGTGQLPKFADDAYKVENQYLIPTAEVPLTNIYRNKIISLDNLPIYITSFTQCFRKEAGSAGRDTKGLIRLHQFNKVEMVKIVNIETSSFELEEMVKDAENILQLFDLPYRVIELCSGDIGFSSSKTYDLEVWFPNQNKYREISSCSNCLDFQAKRMNMRYKNKDGKINYVHTLNGSGLAIDRLIAAILENYYDGEKLILPKILVPYFNGKEFIK